MNNNAKPKPSVWSKIKKQLMKYHMIILILLAVIIGLVFPAPGIPLYQTETIGRSIPRCVHGKNSIQFHLYYDHLLYLWTETEPGAAQEGFARLARIDQNTSFRFIDILGCFVWLCLHSSVHSHYWLAPSLYSPYSLRTDRWLGLCDLCALNHGFKCYFD